MSEQVNTDKQTMSRWLLLVLGGIVAAGLLHVMIPVWCGHSGMVWGDSYTYACFGRLLARGHFFFDGPIGEAFSVVAEQGRDVHSPVWNSNILPNGRTVYSIAMGYPLFLSLMLRLGGTWLLLHSNLILLVVMLLFMGLVVWEGLGRSSSAFIIAAGTMLIIPRLSPATFSQFSYLWREPLFFSCILVGCYAFLRFLKSTHSRWLYLMAFMMGYACAVKEANIIYIPWLGLLTVCSRVFWQRTDKVKIIVLCALCFFAGIAPLLIQNMISTGNPLVSAQTLRATDKEVTSKGMGLSAGNASTTLQNYLDIYARKSWFAWPWLVLAGSGICASLRFPVGRLLLGLAVAHILLYCQWGNAEQRHMYWINFPYAFYVSCGIFYILKKGSDYIGKQTPGGVYVPVILLSILAAWPVPWKIDDATAQERIQYKQAHQLAVEIEQQVEPESLILVNRVVRDVLGAYSDLYVIRMHGLLPLREDGDTAAVLEEMMANGVAVYFLDNTDKDPHHNGIVDWAWVDYETLYTSFDLHPLATFDREEYRLSRLMDEPHLTMYRVSPWQLDEGQKSCEVPDSGAAYLYIHQRSLVGDLQVEVNGTPLALPADGFYYVPVYDMDLSTNAVVTWHSERGVVPQMDDLHFVGWQDKIQMDFGADAIPADAPFFPIGIIEQYPENTRRLIDSTVVTLPLRQRDDLFTVIGLAVKARPGRNIEIRRVDEADPLWVIPNLKNQSAWFPLFLDDKPRPWAGDIDVQFTCPGEALFGVSEIVDYTAFKRYSFQPDEKIGGFVIEGKLALTDPGHTNVLWSLSVNGRPIDQGYCGPNPFMEQYTIIQPIVPGQQNYEFVWQGVGLIDPVVTVAKPDFSVAMDKPEKGFIVDGVYDRERDENGRMFAWTHQTLIIDVPVVSGSTTYILELEAMDGHPQSTRDLYVSFAGQTNTITLTPECTMQRTSFTAEYPFRGLQPVTFSIQTWSPADLLNTRDDRDLGFRFYSLNWYPAKP